MNIPHCHAHGDLCMPMLRSGLWWCPTGAHLVVSPVAIQPRPIDLKRIPITAA